MGWQARSFPSLGSTSRRVDLVSQHGMDACAIFRAGEMHSCIECADSTAIDRGWHYVFGRASTP
eukprot:1183719-Prorocentrum_minimum.AAC.10